MTRGGRWLPRADTNPTTPTNGPKRNGRNVAVARVSYGRRRGGVDAGGPAVGLCSARPAQPLGVSTCGSRLSRAARDTALYESR